MKNSRFILLIIFLVIIVVGYRYNEYVLSRHFDVLATTECDPISESCFFWDCTVDEEEDCDTTPYGKVEMAAYETPSCLLENNCEEFFCEDYKTCEAVMCSEETVSSWEGCTSPEEYHDQIEKLDNI